MIQYMLYKTESHEHRSLTIGILATTLSLAMCCVTNEQPPPSTATGGETLILSDSVSSCLALDTL